MFYSWVIFTTIVFIYSLIVVYLYFHAPFLSVSTVSAIVSGSAWEDQDDDSVRVNLATANRTRKLRINDEETTINGHQFSQRLREQYVCGYLYMIPYIHGHV